MRYVAIVYFDGHASRWRRASAGMAHTGGHPYEEHPGGLRIPLPHADGSMMPEPDPSEVVQRREFRLEWIARVWGLARVRGFEKLLVEVRPA